MEITPNNPTESLSFPLSLYKSVKIGEATGKDGARFFIFVGLDKKLAGELKKLSLDESDVELQKNTSDRERFGAGSYEAWYAKDRVPFALTSAKTGELAAIAWFGPKALGRKSQKHLSEKEKQENENLIPNENWHTISYRCYPHFRGKGLMKGFVGFAMNLYIKHNPGIKIWAGINSENMASDALATGLGFQVDEDASDRAAHWLVMIKQ